MSPPFLPPGGPKARRWGEYPVGGRGAKPEGRGVAEMSPRLRGDRCHFLPQRAQRALGEVARSEATRRRGHSEGGDGLVESPVTVMNGAGGRDFR
jgi:hypothetical protein